MDDTVVNFKVDGKDYQAPVGTTILTACRNAGIDIPTLCYFEEILKLR